MIDGTWSGTISNDYTSYEMILECDYSQNSYIVNYPTYGCGGYFSLLSKKGNQATFRENTTYGTLLVLMEIK
ncbi:hypothetical protein D0T57_02600 [Dysgonomonas sp. 511]|nr:hypothetical protein [Dysgonomonas sp. 511]